MPTSLHAVRAENVHRTWPHLEGIIGVLNTATDGTSLRILQITASPHHVLPSNLYLLSRYYFDRIVSATGGREIPFVKFDTNDPALDSNIKLRVLPTSFSSSSQKLGWRQEVGTNFWLGYAPNQPGAQQPMFIGSGQNVAPDNCELYRRGWDGSVQAWTLQEGEGIALVMNEESLGKVWSSDLTIHDGTNAYLAQIPSEYHKTPSFPGQAAWTLVNDDGSGKIVTVRVIRRNEPGISYAPENQFVSLIKTHGLVAADGNTITPINFDTTKACPATIYGVAAPFSAMPKAAGEGAYYDLNYDYTRGSQVMVLQQVRYSRYRTQLMAHVMQISGTIAPVMKLGPETFQIYSAAPGSEAIVCRRGEGFALCGWLPAWLMGYITTPLDVEIIFAVDTPTVGGGGNTYSRGRVVNV